MFMSSVAAVQKDAVPAERVPALICRRQDLPSGTSISVSSCRDYQMRWRWSFTKESWPRIVHCRECPGWEKRLSNLLWDPSGQRPDRDKYKRKRVDESLPKRLLASVRPSSQGRPRGPLGMQLAVGNRKVGADTLTLNMGPGLHCPSAARGLCLVRKRFHYSRCCFSRAAEERFPNVYRRRREQEIYWRNTPAILMIRDFDAIRVRFPTVMGRIKYFRFNEAGDFWSQECIKKANVLADHLTNQGLIVYCNTARSDLDWSNTNFIVRGSGWDGPNGETVVIDGGEKVPSGFRLCPMNCRRCSLCRQPFNNIAYRFHIGGLKAA